MRHRTCAERLRGGAPIGCEDLPLAIGKTACKRQPGNDGTRGAPWWPIPASRAQWRGVLGRSIQLASTAAEPACRQSIDPSTLQLLHLIEMLLAWQLYNRQPLHHSG